MPKVDWKKWIRGCVETVVYFGKSSGRELSEQEVEARRELDQLSKRRRIHSECTDEEESNGASR